MGNRGRLHDAQKHLVTQRWTTQRWICCQLDFKGRKRMIMTPDGYTELFFLDEATALAAGHRPCGKCSRAEYRRFLEAWNGSANAASGVAALDRQLHRERIAILLDGARPVAIPGSLPNGVMVRRTGESACLLANRTLWRWSHEGYARIGRIDADEQVTLLTAPMIVDIICRGYDLVIHPSAAIVP